MNAGSVQIVRLVEALPDDFEALSLRAADGQAARFWEAAGFQPTTSGTRRSHLLTR